MASFNKQLKNIWTHWMMCGLKSGKDIRLEQTMGMGKMEITKNETNEGLNRED
jgi:hypothetical protein